MILGCASAVRAEEPDAGVPARGDEDSASGRKSEDKHPRLVKPKGDREDNEQLGGEPSLTEPNRARLPRWTARRLRGGGRDEEDDCDLDCLEAQLTEEEKKEDQKKGTLQVARETGSISEETGEDAGDALSAEPSTTTLAEAEPAAPEDRTLPMRLGPVRIKVGKTDDWIGIGFAAQMEFEYDQQFAGGGRSERLDRDARVSPNPNDPVELLHRRTDSNPFSDQPHAKRIRADRHVVLIHALQVRDLSRGPVQDSLRPISRSIVCCPFARRLGTDDPYVRLRTPGRRRDAGTRWLPQSRVRGRYLQRRQRPCVPRRGDQRGLWRTCRATHRTLASGRS